MGQKKKNLYLIKRQLWIRVLGFHRVPPVFGRFINITRDIKEKATNELAKSFFISPGKSRIRFEKV